MGLKKYLVIDTGPTSITFSVTGHSQATASPQPPLRRAVYPEPANLEKPFIDSVLGFAASLFPHGPLCIFIISGAVMLVEGAPSLGPWFVQPIVFFVTCLVLMTCSIYLQSNRLSHVHIDGEEGVLVAGCTRYELSHVPGFFAAEQFNVTRSDSEHVTSVNQFQVLLVSLYRPIIMTFRQDESDVRQAISHLNAFLRRWQHGSHGQSPLPCTMLKRFEGLPGSMKITRQSTLISDHPSYSSLHIKEGDDGSLSCYRRLPLCNCFRRLLRFFILGTLIWLVSFAISLRKILPLDKTLLRNVIGVTIAWTIPSLALLALSLKKEKWDIAPDGMIRHRTGWLCFSTSCLYDVSETVAVTLDLRRAKSRSSSEACEISGRRFELTWRYSGGGELFKIHKLLGAEAAFLAEKLRVLYPDMFGEGEDEQ